MKFDTIIIDEAAQAGQGYPFALLRKVLWSGFFCDVIGQIPIKPSIQRYTKKGRFTCALYIIVPGLCQEALTRDRNMENHAKTRSMANC